MDRRAFLDRVMERRAFISGITVGLHSFACG